MFAVSYLLIHRCSRENEITFSSTHVDFSDSKQNKKTNKQTIAKLFVAKPCYKRNFLIVLCFSFLFSRIKSSEKEVHSDGINQAANEKLEKKKEKITKDLMKLSLFTFRIHVKYVIHGGRWQNIARRTFTF